MSETSRHTDNPSDLTLSERGASTVEALRTAIAHIEHMGRYIAANTVGYSFESLGEDMPGMRAALATAPLSKLDLPEGKYVLFTESGAGRPCRIVLQFQALADMQRAHDSILKATVADACDRAASAKAEGR